MSFSQLIVTQLNEVVRVGARVPEKDEEKI